MLQHLFTSAEPRNAPDVLQHFVKAAGRMPESTRALWSTRFSHVYGDLAGQRAVDLDAMRKWVGAESSDETGYGVLFGIQTYFALIADLLAAGAAHGNSAAVIQDWSHFPRVEFARFLHRLSSGEVLADRGVHGAASAFDFDWYVDALDAQGVEALRALISLVAHRWEGINAASAQVDPISGIYTTLLPRNLLHVLGEVYTPGWLAELVIEDSGWRPGQRLIDPFGGSGVFALAALRIAARSGTNLLKILPDLCLIDLNPLACVAARTNIVLSLRDAIRNDSRDDVYLPVLSGDALAPALVSNRAPSRQTLFPDAPQIAVDGELLPVPLERDGGVDVMAIATALDRYGVRMPQWLTSAPASRDEDRGRFGAKDRRFWEQLAILALRPADVLVTNPPWVGWEYIARPYRAYLDPAWGTYGLFNAKGRNASFLKEDLSTLALVTAWDRYLASGGISVVVLRSNTMLSTLAAQGLRRLSVFPATDPLRLERIRIFDGMRVFPTAQVDAATWKLTKGYATEFPVPVDSMSPSRSRWQPEPGAFLADVRKQMTSRSFVAERVSRDDNTSRWLIGTGECVQAARVISGKNAYVGRTGVFTGGANAVYYLRPDGAAPVAGLTWFTNVTERAKRNAPSVRVQLETDLVYEVVRGRDLTRWASRSGGLLLFPHSRDTRMRALPPAEMQARYPCAFSYLTQMRPILDQRKGFTEWERNFQEEAFYAIQRVGNYTFAPYKVAWRYIATDFLVAVIGPDPKGRPSLPNDKVMFVGVESESEAFYLCGILSSDPFRWKVTAYASGTQISATAIEPLGVKLFSATDPLHAEISQACRAGHVAMSHGAINDATAALAQVNAAASKLYGIDHKTMRLFRAELESAHRTDWQQLQATEDDERLSSLPQHPISSERNWNNNARALPIGQVK